MNTQQTTEFDASWTIQLAKEAGEIALKHFRRTIAMRKADNTIVTEADHEVERYLTGALRARYPIDGILGEEGTSHQRQAPRQWVLDPIDGTSVFSFGLPIWSICIGLMFKNEPIAGIVYLPATNDCFVADVAGPALLNGEPIYTAAEAPLNSESILFGAADAHRLWQIKFPGKVRAFGSCAAHLCYVARGSAVAALNTNTALWDIAAALPILKRAGGECILLDGSPVLVETLLDGCKLPLPILAAPPYYLDVIRTHTRFLDGNKPRPA